MTSAVTQEGYRFNGADYQPGRDNPRLVPQYERIRDLMLDGEWRTLAQIAAATGDKEASISAQLRHLRKPRFGCYLVDRRHLGQGLYEYRVRRPAPVRPSRDRPVTAGAQPSLFGSLLNPTQEDQ